MGIIKPFVFPRLIVRTISSDCARRLPFSTSTPIRLTVKSARRFSIKFFLIILRGTQII
jgi:hypothetical protein